MKKQQGSVFFIALIVLVAMALSGIALVRSMDTSVLVAGNIAFRQSTLHGADLAIETARDWLVANAKICDASSCPLQKVDMANSWYSPNVAAGGIDVAAFPWEKNAKSVTDATGQTVSFVLHRLCSQAGPTSGANNCISSEVTGKTSDYGSDKSVGAVAPTTPQTYYYRVTARITGPRDTVSYVQAIIEM